MPEPLTRNASVCVARTHSLRRRGKNGLSRFEEIQRFVEANGRAPTHAMTRIYLSGFMQFGWSAFVVWKSETLLKPIDSDGLQLRYNCFGDR